MTKLMMRRIARAAVLALAVAGIGARAQSGQSDATRNGIITAGVAVVFWPAAPLVLLAKGKDVTINKGMTFDVFTDELFACV